MSSDLRTLALQSHFQIKASQGGKRNHCTKSSASKSQQTLCNYDIKSDNNFTRLKRLLYNQKCSIQNKEYLTHIKQNQWQNLALQKEAW